MASPIGSSRKGRRCRCRLRRRSRWTSATSPPATTTGSRCGRATSSASWPTGSDELGVPIIREREVTGFAQDDTGVDVELSDGTIAAGRVPRRVRRRTQRGPQGRRHRVRRVGSDDQLADRRGRDGRGAGVRPASGRRHRSRGRRRKRSEGRRGRADGTAARARRRAHPAGPPRGAHRRRRDRLRGAQPDLDLPLHRHDPAGGVLPRRDASCSRATPPTCIPRRAGRASTSACRMR